MASHEVTGGDFLELGHAFCTGICSVGAAGAERTAGGSIQGRGDITGEDDALVFSCLDGIRQGNSGHQALGVRMQGMVVDLVGYISADLSYPTIN